MNRRQILTALATLPLLGVSPAPARLRVWRAGFSMEIDPFVDDTIQVDDVAWIYADGLVGASRKGATPLLIERIPTKPNGAISRNGLTVRYQLRDGIRWHDGKALEAGDVVEAFERVKEKAWIHYRPFNLVTKIVKLDRLAFEVNLSLEDPLFVETFFAAGGRPALPLVRAGKVPLGTGPFSVRTANRSEELVRFDAWPGSPRGVPLSSGIDLRIIGEPNTLGAALLGGDADVALYLRTDFADQHKNELGWVKEPGGIVALIANAGGALASREMRTAVWSTIDRETLRQQLYGNSSSAVDSLVPRSSGISPAIRYHYDLEYARKILASLRAPLQFATIGGKAESLGLLLQTQLKMIGVELVIRRYDPKEYFAIGGPMRTGKFDIAVDGFSVALEPDILSKLGCEAVAPKGANFSRTCDAGFEAAVLKGDYARAMGALSEAATVFPLARLFGYIGHANNVKGVELFDLTGSYYNIARWVRS